MKAVFILLTSLLSLLLGCGSTENTASSKNMLVENAIIKPWSEPPSAGSDIPERGIDLTVTIRNWPQGYMPQYIIYNKRKSFNASIADSSENSIIVEARIVQASSVLAETSESTEASDRLVFATTEGEKGYIEINNWQKAKE